MRRFKSSFWWQCVIKDPKGWRIEILWGAKLQRNTGRQLLCLDIFKAEFLLLCWDILKAEFLLPYMEAGITSYQNTQWKKVRDFSVLFLMLPKISGLLSPQAPAKYFSKNIHIIAVLEAPDLFWHCADPTGGKKKGNPSLEAFPETVTWNDSLGSLH